MEFKRGGEHRIVTVPDRTLIECRDWAGKVEYRHSFQASHKVGPGGSYEDRFVGKVCEAAFAQLIGCNVDWNVRQHGGDGSRDTFVKMNNKQFSVDVKGTGSPNAQRLLWPINKAFAHCADILVFARARRPDHALFGQVWIPGFVMRDQFKRLHCEAADDDRRGMVPGTWFMDWRELTPIEVLYAATRTCRECGASAEFADRAGPHCFAHSGFAPQQTASATA